MCVRQECAQLKFIYAGRVGRLLCAEWCSGVCVGRGGGLGVTGWRVKAVAQWVA